MRLLDCQDQPNTVEERSESSRCRLRLFKRHSLILTTPISTFN